MIMVEIKSTNGNNHLGGDDFEALRYAIYYNSMLDSEELIKVENCIKERKLV
mgnify:CR=1 FL=1